VTRTFLRAPSGAAEITADALRALGVIGIVVAGIGWGPVEGAGLAFVAVGMFLPRLLDVRPSVDIFFGIVVLMAVWSSVLDIYPTTRWWDIPMHFLTGGLCAALCYIVLVRLGIVADSSALPRPVSAAVVTTTALGISLGALWEIYEWFVYAYGNGQIYVGYIDTIGDLFWDGAGALAAGFSMSFLRGPAAGSQSRAAP
jgi:hypothetical protein